MDIQKEKDAYLGELLERDAITQDEYNDIIFRPSVNAFDSNYLSARFIDNINWGWNSWQAAKAKSVPEVINVGNELQSWVAVWSFKARHDREDYIVVDASLLAEKIEKLTGANA